MCIGVLSVCMSVHYMCVWCLKKRRGHWMLSEHMDAGNQTQVLWKSSQCSEPANHLSSPQNTLKANLVPRREGKMNTIKRAAKNKYH